MKRIAASEGYPLFRQYRNRFVIVRMADGNMFRGYVESVDPINVYLVYSPLSPAGVGRIVLPLSLISSVGLID